MLALANNEVFKFFISDYELEDLINKRLITKSDNGNYILRRFALREFNIVSTNKLEEEFEELFNLFPRMTPNKRILRPAKTDTKLGTVLFAKYKKARTKYSFEVILKGLKAEINSRTHNNSREYMHNMETWFNKGGWEIYEEYFDSNSIKDESNDFIDLG